VPRGVVTATPDAPPSTNALVLDDGQSSPRELDISPRQAVSGIVVAMERRTSTAAQRTGDAGEALAETRLVADGWTILARNLRVGRDEVDLLAVDPGPPAALVLVEVRRRGRRDYGLAEETLDHRKRTALRRVAGALLALPTLPDGRPLPRLPLRVDLVAIDPGPDGRPSIRHHRGIRP